jgi:hypothetical protein
MNVGEYGDTDRAKSFVFYETHGIHCETEYPEGFQRI